MVGSVIVMDGHSGRGWNALSMTKILHCDRNAMQGTTSFASGDLLVCLLRLSQRQIGSNNHVALQPAIKPRDTIENRLRHLDRGYLPRLNALPNLDEIEKA